jgi:H+/Na+-translocating ferredoxin:NAD+ oxidoreductase subunit G
MTLRLTASALTIALATLLAAPSARADQIFWSTEALLKDFFKHSDRVSYVRVETERASAELRSLLGDVPAKSAFVVFIAKTGAHIDGYAVIDDQPGEHLPITFGVKLSPAGSVERMEVMVYREGYGSEIRETRFREQFVGKQAADPIRFGDDVAAISGATISSKAIAVGVRRAVALVSILKKHTLDAERETASAREPQDARPGAAHAR